MVLSLFVVHEPYSGWLIDQNLLIKKGDFFCRLDQPTINLLHTRQIFE